MYQSTTCLATSCGSVDFWAHTATQVQKINHTSTHKRTRVNDTESTAEWPRRFQAQWKRTSNDLKEQSSTDRERSGTSIEATRRHTQREGTHMGLRRRSTYRIVLSVLRRIHCGSGRFWRAFLASFFFSLSVLWAACGFVRTLSATPT